MTQPPVFTYLTVASTLHDEQTVDAITAPLRATLDALGGASVSDSQANPHVPLAIVVATGGTEGQILDAVQQRREMVPFEPALLFVHPLHNSLPAALEALARLRSDGINGLIVQSGSPHVARSLADVGAIHRLRRTRLGLVGEPSPWLVASVPDSDLLRARWGIELVRVDIASTIDAYNRLDDPRGGAVARHFAGSAAPSRDLVNAARVHPTLEDAIRDARVDAITVRCFDYLTALSTSGCIALAELNDRGLVAGCEGDVASAVAMVLVRVLLEQPSWIANPAWIDTERNTVLLAHCTVAPSMVAGVELHTHFESGLGVGLRGRFTPGPVTLLRLGGNALERRWICEGSIVRSGDSENICRTQALVHLDDQPAQSLLEEPLGNHLVLMHGHHRERLERWSQLAFDAAPTGVEPTHGS